MNDKQFIKEELKRCKSVGDMFECLQRQYLLYDCVPGPITRPQVVKGLITAIEILRPKQRPNSDVARMVFVERLEEKKKAAGDGKKSGKALKAESKKENKKEGEDKNVTLPSGAPEPGKE
jgi:hypothetical protein